MSRYKIFGCIAICTSLFIYPEPPQVSMYEYVCSALGPFAPQVSGYIKHESFFDSRQVVSFGDGEALVWPENQLFDTCCTDINAQSQFNMVPIETVVECRWCGPQIGSATSSAVIDGDFFGPSDPLSLLDIVNIIQLRHVFIQLDWPQVKFMAGHCYHPLITLDCYPGTISNNSGNPFDPYSKNPQLRLIYHKGKFSIMGAALMELNYPSDGPIGESTTYERDAIIPNVHLQSWVKSDQYLVGAAVDYKLLKPRLKTDTNYRTNSTIGSSSFMLYCTLSAGDYNIKSKIIYGQNLLDMTMIGGYAVHSIDPVTDIAHYTTLNVVSWWADISRKTNDFEPGIFLGMCKNLGAQKTIMPDDPSTIYAFGQDIDTVMRIAPRLRWACTESVVFGCEAEYTSAAYGTTKKDGTVSNTNSVGNIRLVAALYYNF